MDWSEQILFASQRMPGGSTDDIRPSRIDQAAARVRWTEANWIAWLCGLQPLRLPQSTRWVTGTLGGPYCEAAGGN